MGKCVKCNSFLPPNLIETNMKCIFCNIGSNYIDFKGVRYRKEDAVREYQMFLNKVKEKNSILKDVALGKSEIPDIFNEK